MPVSNSAAMRNASLTVASSADHGDQLLIDRAIGGDRGAARALYDRHAERVYRLAYRMCGDPELARDVTQDVFVRVFGQLQQFRGASAFTTWLHRVAVNTCLNTLRKVSRWRHREVELDAAVEEAGALVERDPVLDRAMTIAIDALPEQLRVVLVMYAIEGYTHGEIAAVLGIAEGTSKSRLFDARAQLRVALAAERKEYVDD